MAKPMVRKKWLGRKEEVQNKRHAAKLKTYSQFKTPPTQNSYCPQNSRYARTSGSEKTLLLHIQSNDETSM
jgi:hypothetical protein